MTPSGGRGTRASAKCRARCPPAHGVAVFLTLRLRFVQCPRVPARRPHDVPTAIERGRGVLTPFQTFATALAATIGMGNIAGVATAVVSGGPGAVFWIRVLRVLRDRDEVHRGGARDPFRVTTAGRFWRGPPYYLRDGLSGRWLAWSYALIAGVAALTTTPFTQPNSIALVV